MNRDGKCYDQNRIKQNSAVHASCPSPVRWNIQSFLMERKVVDVPNISPFRMT